MSAAEPNTRPLFECSMLELFDEIQKRVTACVLLATFEDKGDVSKVMTGYWGFHEARLGLCEIARAECMEAFRASRNRQDEDEES